MSDDIRERIIRDYGADRLERIEALFDEYEGPERERVLRCILHLADRDFELLEHDVSVAKSDYRDVIFWAEYDRDDKRVHDFSAGFA